MCASSVDSTLLNALFAVHAVLDDEGIEHALCGGIAANLYREEVRATTDVDLYVACAAPQLVTLARRFESEGWRAHPVWRQAELVRLDHDALPRVDLLVASTSFERAAVGRAIEARVDDEVIPVLRAEDLIVFKLVAGRARDYEAVAAIINAHLDELDTDFVERSLADLGVEDRWARALDEAKREGG